MMKNNNIIVILIIFFFMLFIIVMYVHIQNRKRLLENKMREDEIQANMDAHAYSFAVSGLHYFALSIQLCVTMANEEVPQNIQGLIIWISEKSPASILNLQREYYGDPRLDGKVRDWWGKPIQLKVISKRRYILVSCGKNGRYENGGGDDATFSFDPLEKLYGNKIPSDPNMPNA